MDLPDLSPALERARAGDPDAVADLFQALQPRLLRYLRNRAPSAAEDIASETWLSAAQGLGRFVGDGDSFRTWLFTIARRRVADYYRAAGRRVSTVSLDAFGDPGEAAPDPGPDSADIVVEALSAQEAVDRLVAGLPPDQAEVVLLRVVAGLDAEQAGSIMDRSSGAVRVLQHRALRRLAHVWDKGAVPQ